MRPSVKDMIDTARERAKCNDLQGAETLLRQSINDVCAQTCPFPVRIMSKHSITGEQRAIYVPCGKCANCRSRKRNEWVTRMCLHTTYCAKYCYFLTLTYKGYAKYEDVPSYLRNAYYRKDALNYNHVEEYSPCLIRYEHFQRFMKNLRKLHSDKIEFYACSEYGSTYGRPHFHAILWTDVPLKIEDVKLSWSHNRSISRKYPDYDLIGRVELDDLNKNGTLGGDKSSKHNQHNMFSYVAKYCCKSIVDEKLPTARMHLFLTDLHNRVISDDLLNVVFDKRIRMKADLLRDYVFYVMPYVISEEKRQRIEEFCKRTDQSPNYVFDFNPDWEFTEYEFLQFPQNLLDIYEDQQKAAEIIRNYYSFVPYALRKVFAPCCQMSRASGIGFDYASSHIDEYRRGKFKLPKMECKNVVFPSAFLRYAKKQIIGVFAQRKKQLQSSNTFVPLYNQLHFAESFGKGNNEHLHVSFPCVQLPFELAPYDCKKILESDCTFYDYRNKCKCMIEACFDNSFVVHYYKYQRSSRTYVYSHMVDGVKWYSELLANIVDVANIYYQSDISRMDNELMFNYVKKSFTEIVDTFFASKFDILDLYVSIYNNFVQSLTAPSGQSYNKLIKKSNQL